MNHRDQVWINPITHVWTEIINGTYGEMWNPEKFNNDVQLAKEVPIVTTETINGKVRGSVVRKLSDGRYVVSVFVTHIQSGRFSDNNYVIINEQDMCIIQE